MAIFSKAKLSGSTDGKQIKVVATATAGTLIHTAVSGTTDWDEIWLYAYNSDSSSVILTLEWGGVAVPDDLMKWTLPAQNLGRILLLDGKLLQNAKLLGAFADTANVVMLDGFVNQIRA